MSQEQSLEHGNQSEVKEEEEEDEEDGEDEDECP